MKKQVIRMTQNGLQRLINESVRRILDEAFQAQPREHVTLDNCDAEIQRIQGIQDEQERKIAIERLLIDIRDSALKYGERIYSAVCARYAIFNSDFIPKDELDSLIMRMLLISLGLEKNDAGTTESFDPTKEGASFKKYLAQKIAGNIRNYINDKKKKLFNRVNKNEADALLFAELIEPKVNSELLLGRDERGAFKEEIKTNRQVAAEKAWNELAPERTFRGFASIPLTEIPPVFRVVPFYGKEQNVDTDKLMNLAMSDKYDYYVAAEPKDEYVDLDSVSNTLADNLSDTSDYGDITLDTNKAGKSDVQYAFEAINRIVRKVLTEMRKK